MSDFETPVKRILILLSVFGFIFSSPKTAASQQDFSDLKKGKFIMTGPSGGEIKIKRNRKFQTERYNREHQRYKFKIEWINEYTYELTLKKGGKKSKNAVGSKISVKIIENTPTLYIAVITGSEASKKIEVYKR